MTDLSLPLSLSVSLSLGFKNPPSSYQSSSPASEKLFRISSYHISVAAAGHSLLGRVHCIWHLHRET